jgi:hypothetical protein
MALSKAEARDRIVALSKELEIEAPANLDQIDKLDQLMPLVEDLEAKKAAKAPAPPTPPAGPRVGAPPPAPSETAPPPQKKLVATTYKVNEGKSLQTKRGLIGALEHVWPTDFGGGQADLDHWVTHEYVTKTEHFEQ